LHVNVESAHKTFNGHKIFVAKEEGDSSHANQSHDQIVAKPDKAWMQNHVALVCRKLGNKQLDQWTLNAPSIDAQFKTSEVDWIKSHNRVNTQRSQWVPFDLFLKQLIVGFSHMERSSLTNGSHSSMPCLHVERG